MLRIIISTLIFYFCLSLLTAQELSPSRSAVAPSVTLEAFRETVVPITSVRVTPTVKLSISGKIGPALGVGATFGTGFCLDPACRFIATNYHVAMMTQAHTVKGQKIIQRQLATGPRDHDATANYFPNEGWLAYAKKRDLAIFELRHSLSHHHGLAFSLDELQPGQEVDIYGYPKGMVNPVRTLVRLPARFKAPTTSGLLAFEYELFSDKPIRIKGASGGIVVDRKTQKVVGILSETNDTMAGAVPIQTLAEFVRKVQPFLAQKLFPSVIEVPPDSEDVYAKFVPSSDFYGRFEPIRVDGLERRPREPHEVSVLREKAQHLVDSMRDFIAVQSYAWGAGDREPEAQAAYEVRVIDGAQRFRRYPDGTKELEATPNPSLHGWVMGSDQWSHLPRMIGTEYRIKVHQAPDVVLSDRRMKVFQYYSSVEDNLCPFAPVEDFGLFVVSRTVAVACYGEVWTDEDTNIVRISQHLDLSEKLKAYRGWRSYRVIVTYDWLPRTDEPQKLIPRTIFTEARDKKNAYWCRGQFTDYRMFSAQARLIQDQSDY
jgi:Trypsin-like peptidase domain